MMNDQLNPHQENSDPKTMEEGTVSFDQTGMFHAVMDLSPVSVVVFDLFQKVIYCNRQFGVLTGYPEDQVKGKTLQGVFKDLEHYVRMIEGVKLEGRWSGSVLLLHQSGDTIPVGLEIKTWKNGQGDPAGSIGYFSDHSRLIAKDRELENQKEYLATLHAISLGMFRRVKKEELLQAILLRAARLLEIPNGFLYQFNHENKVLEMMAACGNLADSIGEKIEPGSWFAGTVFEQGEPVIITDCKDGSLEPDEVISEKLSCVAGIPLVSGSRIEGVMGLGHDADGIGFAPDVVSVLEEFASIVQIVFDNAVLFEQQKEEVEKRLSLEKEAKAMEKRLLRAQRMEAVGTLAGGISHDFNNILSAIMGFAQMALSLADKESQVAADLNKIYDASLRAKDLVHQVLTFARRSDEVVSPIRIDLIAAEVLKFIRSSVPESVSLESDIAITEKVLANPTQVHQLFLNLLTNSVQAMEKDGGILFLEVINHTLIEPLGEISKGRFVRITIKDTGEGILPENLPQIFNPYFTTRSEGEGTGLGLSVVHGIVKSMGGEILVESHKGLGTTFEIFLPAAEETEEKAPERDPGETIPEGKGQHILFVDDDPSIAELGERMLASLNYKVTSKTDSLETLTIFNENPDEFDLVVTDMSMPEMSGEMLAGKIKAIRKNMPVILCTGHHSYRDIQESAGKGVDYVCRKPIIRDELAKAVSHVLAKIADNA